MYSGYQTIKLPDGEIIQGTFPTLDWFDKIKKHISFKGKIVLDVGSCDGMYSILAFQEGAKEVVGIEQEKEHANDSAQLANIWKVPFSVLNMPVEEVTLTKHFDIVLFPMIIHWIGPFETRKLESWATDYVVFIFREANEGYDKPENGKWFPALKDLDVAFNGLSRVHSEVLMTQDNGKKITLAIYEKVLS